MKAAYMDGTYEIIYRDIEKPVPGENEVLVKIEYVGICGSDVHFYENGRIGDFIVGGPFILGHESAGTIVETGSKVTDLKTGERVALEPGITCGKCEFCKTGRYNLCPEVKFFATPPYHGVLTEYAVHPSDMCFKLPENVSTKEGALVEPLAVGLHAAAQGNVKLGDSVVILGGGCIGLVTLLACKARGAANVIVVDMLQKRLDYAEKLGANHTVNAKEMNVEKELERLLGGIGADVVLETAGAVKTIQQTPEFTKRGGTIVLVGMAPQDVIAFDFAKVMAKELSVKSVFRYRNLYPVAIAAIADGKIDVGKIATHEFDFSDVKLAFDTVIENAQDVVKGVIKVS
ncbi:MAG: NAD(P)-dependent alcohol dehydrogenase [Clostridiales bacterium]|nr:NAD(P)-dependent alcohol dehydrogenase [Clostridiales bacterium]MDU3242347.1 NAD(P)-dependent alcohol dehydrogenase [Clostridiales bacterium]